jgi:hypothetical protein
VNCQDDIKATLNKGGLAERPCVQLSDENPKDILWYILISTLL